MEPYRSQLDNGKVSEQVGRLDAEKSNVIYTALSDNSARLAICLLKLNKFEEASGHVEQAISYVKLLKIGEQRTNAMYYAFNVKARN